MTLMNVFIETHDNLAQPLSEFLTEQGALSTILQASDDEEICMEALDKSQLWKNTTVCALFNKDQFPTQCLKQFEQAFRLDTPLTARIETLPDKDWVSEIQNQFPSQCYQNNLWICPDWDDTPHPEHIVVKLSPGLAFGTGRHPTTQLCVDWLASHSLNDKTVMDYGCGSGILGIAALALGAQAVWATDRDPQAMQSTQNNLDLNPSLDHNRFHLQPLSKAPSQPVDILVANILAQPLLELEPTLSGLTKTNGTLVLSGLLTTDIDSITRAYSPHFTLRDTQQQKEWVRMTWTRHNA